MAALYVQGVNSLQVKLVSWKNKNCRQQTDVVQHPSGRKREQDTLIPTAAVSLSEQHLVKSLKAAAQNQRKKIS